MSNPPEINPMAAMPLLAAPPRWNQPPPVAPSIEVGRSVLGNSIRLFHPGPSNVLVFGGAHGDESEPIFLGHLLLEMGLGVPIIPCLNPDGALLRQRWNRHNVDLNRNLPTKDWQPEPLNPRYPPGTAPASEPETQALLATLEQVKPTILLNLHSYKETFVEVERPPETLSVALNRALDGLTQGLGVERRLSIGYPTPGSTGSFGMENGLLVVTYELLRGMSHGEIEAIAPKVAEFIRQVTPLKFESP